jgi:hypothetical protein
MKISEKNFLFFSTLNQYFLHIPYVASKKWGFLVFKYLMNGNNAKTIETCFSDHKFTKCAVVSSADVIVTRGVNGLTS